MNTQEFDIKFGKNLKYWLEYREKTQADLASYMGVSTSTVSNWCNGIKLPRMDKVDKICDFLTIDHSDLMESGDARSSNKSRQPAIQTSLGSYRITPKEPLYLNEPAPVYTSGISIRKLGKPVKNTIRERSELICSINSQVFELNEKGLEKVLSYVEDLKSIPVYKL